MTWPHWYCPYCGTKVKNREVWLWLTAGPGTQCFDPKCEGAPDCEAQDVQHGSGQESA